MKTTLQGEIQDGTPRGPQISATKKIVIIVHSLKDTGESLVILHPGHTMLQLVLHVKATTWSMLLHVKNAWHNM